MDADAMLVDWDRILEALVAIVILAFFVERSLSLLFEWRHFHSRFGGAGLKEPLAFCVSLLITWQWDFDALSMVVAGEAPTFLGELMTACVIAGGSKASIKLFQDIAGIRNVQATLPTVTSPSTPADSNDTETPDAATP